MSLNRGLLLALALLLPHAVFAVDSSGVPTEAELKQMPPYCTTRIKENDPVGWRNGLAQFGESWNHLHHYCYALAFMNRYYVSRDPSFKRHILQQAIDNINYVIQRAPSGDPLLPQLYLDRGRVLIIQKKDALGLADFQSALAANPGFAPAYRALVTYYDDKKMGKQAMEWAVKGLQYAPDDRGLQRRYRELGGKLPYPEPIQRPAATDAPEPAAVEAKPESLPAVETTLGPAAEATKPVEAAKPVEADAPPKIGSPKNPYCRFCPD